MTGLAWLIVIVAAIVGYGCWLTWLMEHAMRVDDHGNPVPKDDE